MDADTLKIIEKLRCVTDVDGDPLTELPAKPDVDDILTSIDEIVSKLCSFQSELYGYDL